MPYMWVGAGSALLGAGQGMGWWGNSTKPNQPPSYTPTGLPQANQGWLDANSYLQQNAGQTQQYSPYLSQSFQNMMNVPTNGMVNSGYQAGNQYGQLGGMAGNYSGMIGNAGMMDYGGAQNMMNAGNQLWNTSQMAANNQPLQQYMQNQVGQNAALGNSMYGLQGPQAAGNVTNAMDQFSMQWPQYQQQMMANGLQGMTQAYGAANTMNNSGGQNLSGSYNMGSNVPANTLLAGSTPVSTAYNAYGMPMQGFNQYAGATSNMNQPWTNIQSQAVPFMNFGQGAISAGYNNQLAGNTAYNKQQANSTQAFLSGIQGLQGQWGSNNTSTTPQDSGGSYNQSSGNSFGSYTSYA